MISHTVRRSASLPACLLAVALAACGGGAASSQPKGPAPVVVTPPPAGDGTAPAAPKITKPGPNVTPEGVVFNYKADGKGLKIYLAGNFNDWKPDNPQFLMKDDDGDGIWSITVKLAPARISTSTSSTASGPRTRTGPARRPTASAAATASSTSSDALLGRPEPVAGHRAYPRSACSARSARSRRRSTSAHATFWKNASRYFACAAPKSIA